MTDYPHASSPRPADVNYDESRVPDYTLPDPLIFADGTAVTSAQEWLARRRPELLRAFSSQVYGATPGSGTVRVAVADSDESALGGLATRLELDLTVTANTSADGPRLVLRLLLFVPNRRRGPAPAFLGLNFFGNHTIHPDPSIRLAVGWTLNSPELGVHAWKPTEASRGLRYRRWPVELILNRGYALATLYAGDVDPDYHDGFANGAHALFGTSYAVRRDDAWGSIGAWAWGLSRALDALAAVDLVDAGRVGLIGHSRLGKAALWAAAQDQRFAWVIANASGRGGAALSRRRFGELTRHLNARFPHWFAPRFRAYDDQENQLPVDQHELIALVAPRPVYVATAASDLWSDPRGQLLACRHASPVYELFGVPGLREDGEPALNRRIGGAIGYHCRPGEHDVLASDWWHFLDFVDGRPG